MVAATSADAAYPLHSRLKTLADISYAGDMMKANETYMRMLKNVHAMERGMENALGKQLGDMESSGHTDAHRRISDHIDQTRRHAELIEERLRANGGEPSKARNWMAQMDASLGAVSFGEDQWRFAQRVLTGATAEHAEMAMYDALIAAAEDQDDLETARVAREIRLEEENMAQFYDSIIPHAAREALAEAEQAS